MSSHERNHLFLNQQGRQFTDLGGISGLDHIGDSRSFATLDYDRDGWLDMVLVNANEPMVNLYRNQIGQRGGESSGGIVAVRLVGGNQTSRSSKEWSNRDGIGASVTVAAGGLSLLREHRAGEGFAAQNSEVLVVGLGSALQVDSLTVRWPGGTRQSTSDIAVGSLVTVYEDPEMAPLGDPFVVEPYLRNVRSGPPAPHRLRSRLFSRDRIELDVPGSASTLRVFTTMATWCPACRFWQPQLKALATTFGESEVQLFGVPVDPEDTGAKLDDYIEKYQPAYELLTDLSPEMVEEVRGMEKERLGDDVLPKTVVTDGAGRVLEVSPGVPSDSTIRRLLFEQD